ncbi:phosphate propanoyltransferase [Peptoniphilus indolicus]|uniref:Phosphate propanoyltransferase n=2 Tax=Peptoniphilus indolicus TaxID=33030 RepID=G4D1V2_9FIRM|nr:phosphate propanoyltransferase [Peptoniphilus indolicus]EGY80495.1 propanediol utilization protein PduL [Peptoniphilus indolicus ATCC 29427]SUB75535.1 Phosphate propanoyltransferase [Peptoniphilus indolicus]
MNKEKLIDEIADRVMLELKKFENYKIPVGVSNRHVHISREDLDILFGKDYELTVKKELKQPGQFAAEEAVTIVGPKGQFENVRILGPIRRESQVEISLTDAFRLGVSAPIKESGSLENTPGIEIVGPKGSVKLERGTIVALRHIHLTPSQAKKFNVKEGEFVDVQCFGCRKATISNVLIRVSEKYSIEMHLDTDEANAIGVKNGDFIILSKILNG